MTGTPTDAENRGVTPVVGIIVLIAITVLLAGTAGAFFLGLSGDQTQEGPPSTVFEFDYTENSGGNDELRITHMSGDSIQTDQLYVAVDGANCAGGTDDPDDRWSVGDVSGFGMNGMFVASNTLVIDEDSPEVHCSSGTLDLRGATVEVIWQSPSGGTQVLSRERL